MFENEYTNNGIEGINMYKYTTVVKQRGLFLLVSYYLFVVRISEHKDRYGSIRLYAKINWWHPIIIIITVLLLLGAIIRDIYKTFTKDLVEFFDTNKDNYKKGLFVGYYNKDKQ